MSTSVLKISRALEKAPSWLPAVVMMGLIFAFSATPSSKLPYFDWAELLVKKGAHMIGYGLLALSLWWWFAREGLFVNAALVAAWSFSVLYASSDEFHQSFVAGRHASWVDVVIDAVGAAIFLTVLKASSQQKNDR